jgi:glycosyltransferase involved in cell wall biosynthesis
MKYSIVITFYNSFDPEKAIKGAMAQSIKPTEIILVDDCSKDKFRDQLENVARREKCELYSTVENSGPAGARNLGVSKSSNNFIIFMDDDDLSTENRAEIHLEGFRRGSDLSYVSSIKQYPNGQSFDAINETYTGKLNPKDISSYLLSGAQPRNFPKIYIPACTLAVRKNSLTSDSPFDSNLRRLEDVDFAISASENGLTFSFSKNIGVIRNSSIGLDKSSEVENLAQWQILHKYSFYFNKHDANRFEQWNKVRANYFAKNYFNLFYLLLLYILRNGFDSRKFLNSIRRLAHDIKQKRWLK